jgi:hypothetical protein
MVGARPVRAISWGAIAMILLASPACGPDGFTAPWMRSPDGASPYIVNRPAYADGARPFFVGGYAGANYEPFVGGPRAAFGVPLPGPARPPVVPAAPPSAVPVSPPPPEPAGPPAVSATPGSWETE